MTLAYLIFSDDQYCLSLFHNDGCSYFARGGDLLRARGRDQLLPSWGQKEVDPSGSWLEEKQIDARLRDRQMLLEEPKFARR